MPRGASWSHETPAGSRSDRPARRSRSREREVDAFVAEAMSVDDKGDLKHPLGVMFTLMFTLGVRPVEATGFLWSDFDPEQGPCR